MKPRDFDAEIRELGERRERLETINMYCVLICSIALLPAAMGAVGFLLVGTAATPLFLGGIGAAGMAFGMGKRCKKSIGITQFVEKALNKQRPAPDADDETFRPKSVAAIFNPLTAVIAATPVKVMRPLKLSLRPAQV